MKQFLFFSLLTVGFALIGCQKGSNPAPAATAPARVAPQGPGDGGGGDLCNGRMIESFRIKDVSALDEYSEFLKPIVEGITAKKEDGSPNVSVFTLSPHIKNWYLVDCPLYQIPKEVNGLYFETTQAAVHRPSEIFIDSAVYAGMAKEERAKLLLHEMVMGYYLLKYLPISDLCKFSENCTGSEKITHWKMFAPQPYRPLNDSDHANIRAVTAWLWEHRTDANEGSFQSALKKYNFDPRFQYVSTAVPKFIDMDAATLLRMFKRYQWSKQLPKYCDFDPLTAVSKTTCDAEISAEKRAQSPTNSNDVIAIKIKISRASDAKLWENEFIIPLDHGKIRISQNSLGNFVGAGVFGAFANWPVMTSVIPKEGDRLAMLLLFLNLKDEKNPEIFQIEHQSYAWYSFEEVIQETNGTKMKTTYGYRTVLKDEYVSLFAEESLPFLFSMPETSKDFIRSELVP